VSFSAIAFQSYFGEKCAQGKFLKHFGGTSAVFGLEHDVSLL